MNHYGFKKLKSKKISLHIFIYFSVLKRDHIQSQMFAFDASSFFANIPDGIGNITSEIIKLQAEGFAAKAVGQINGNIDYLFKQTCSTNHGTFA